MEENIILETKPSWIVIVPHIIGFAFFIGMFTIWGAIIRILTTKLKITDKRVEGKVGLIHTERMDSRIGQITSVKTEQGIIGKIFNYGTVYINAAGGDNYSFSYIPSPEKVRKAINEAIGR